MFEDVEQLEKEIESFRKNMMASSDLVIGITELTEVTKQQKESFSVSSDKLAQKIDTCIEQIKKDHSNALQTLSNNNDTAINSLQEKMIAEQKNHIAELDRIKTSLIDMQGKYMKELHRTEEKIQSYQAESEKKYNNCIQRLENVNMESLIKEVQNLKLTLQEKMIAEQKNREAELDQINTSVVDMQTKYTEELHQTQGEIRKYQLESLEKYNDCMQRLENVNMESLIKEVQDLKQTFQKKTLILTCGVAVTLIITILQLLGL